MDRPGTLHWRQYLLTIIGTAACALLLVKYSPFVFTLMLLLAPVTVAAYVGGLRVGLLSMITSVVVSEVTLLTLDANAPGALQGLLGRWIFFIALSCLICVLNEMLHRAKARAESIELSRLAMLANIADAVVVTDAQGRIQYLNPAAAMLCGLDAIAAQGRRFDELIRIEVHDASGHVTADDIRGTAVTRHFSGDSELLRADGSSVPVEVTAAPLRLRSPRAPVSSTEAGTIQGTVLTLRDCTAQRSAAAAIEERLVMQERLERIAALSPGAMHSFRLGPGSQRQMVYASPSYCELLECTEADILSDVNHAASRVHPDDHHFIGLALQEGARNSTPVRVECRFMLPRRGLVWLELNAMPQREPDGAVLWHGILTDITTRKEEERALRNSEARLAGIIASAMDAIVTLDETQGIVLFNAAAERMFMKPARAMLGKHLTAFINECFVSNTRMLEWLRQPGIVDLARREEVIGKREGVEFPIEWSMSRSFANDHQLLTLNLRDITERRDAERRLQNSQADLRAALEAGSLGVMQLLADDRVAVLDEIAARQWNLAAGDSNPRRLIRAIVAEDRGRVLREWRNAVLRGQPVHVEFRVIHADEEVHWLVCRGRVEFDTVLGGKPKVRLTCIITDVSFRRQLEEQRLRSQKLEALGVLAGGIAHDFNNLLLAISGNIRLASSELPETHPAQLSLHETVKATTRATALVRRILTFSSPQDHEFRSLEINAVISEVVQLARAALPASLQLECVLPQHSPVVHADADQIHQAVLNLLTNAADAVDPFKGIIRVIVSSEAVSMHTAMTTPGLHAGDYACVTVTDNGQGMSGVTMQRVFDPFFSTKPRGQGTGLGLAIVHGIMSGHGGAVSVSSEPGKGATLTLYFPLEAQLAPPVVEESLPVLQQHHARILYVDDEGALVYLMTRTLERMGHHVTGCSSAAQALQQFTAAPMEFEVVVSDMSMPGMSGIDLARQMIEMRPALPVIITTGYIKAEDQERAQAVGVRRIILKPNTVEELGAVIAQVLREPALSPASPVPAHARNSLE